MVFGSHPLQASCLVMTREVQMSESLLDRRRRAGFSLLRGEDFLSVAKEHGITPRTLLAWQRHEYGKWENDPYEGREPGPADNYDGEWPSEREELEAYARMRLDPTRLDDEDLRKRYAAFLREWNAMLESRARQRGA